MKRTVLLLVSLILCLVPMTVSASNVFDNDEIKEVQVIQPDRFYKYIDGKLYEVSDSKNAELLEAKKLHEQGVLDSDINAKNLTANNRSEGIITPMAAVPVESTFVKAGEIEEYYKYGEEEAISDIVQGPATVGYEHQKTYSWTANISLTGILKDAVELAGGIEFSDVTTRIRSAEWEVPSGVRGQLYFVPIYHNVWGNLTTTYYVSPFTYYDATNYVDAYTPHNYGYVYLKER